MSQLGNTFGEELPAESLPVEVHPVEVLPREACPVEVLPVEHFRRSLERLQVEETHGLGDVRGALHLAVHADAERLQQQLHRLL